MPSLAPNLDYQRWPALDEHGLAEFESSARRSVARKPRPSVKIDALPPRGDDSVIPCGEDGGSGDPPINGSHPHFPDGWELHIAQHSFIELMTYFWGRPPEAAGVLFGPADDRPLVTRFIPDHLGRGTPVAFELHTPYLNQLLQELKATGLTCKGLVHSHPDGFTQPSGGDLAYFRRLFDRPANAETTHVFVPIVSGGRLYPYVYTELGVAHATLVVV